MILPVSLKFSRAPRAAHVSVARPLGPPGFATQSQRSLCLLGGRSAGPPFPPDFAALWADMGSSSRKFPRLERLGCRRLCFPRDLSSEHPRFCISCVHVASREAPGSSDADSPRGAGVTSEPLGEDVNPDRKEARERENGSHRRRALFLWPDPSSSCDMRRCQN